jgi:hypothetical protein
VALIYDLKSADRYVAIGERKITTTGRLKAWAAQLRSTGTVDYQRICGKTSVQATSVKIDGKAATVDALNCGGPSNVDAVVSTVANGYGLVVTCHSSHEAAAVVQQDCLRSLEKLKFD